MANYAKVRSVLAAVLTLFFFVACNGRMDETDMSKKTLRVAIPADQNLSEYDPARIFYTHQYILLENLYSQLVTYDTSGEIVSGLAERFEWVGNDAKFTLRDGIVSVGGGTIGALDVVLSLKRLLILQSNTHGDLSNALCGDRKLISLSDDCPNLLIEGDKTVVFKMPKKDPFLFSMLTAVDFSVIPASAIDPKTLKIIDYGITSGPYYVEKDCGGGSMELAANPAHFQYIDKMPQKIVVVPALTEGKSTSLQLFKDGKVDMVTTAEMSNSHDIAVYAEASGNASIFKTIPIKLEALTFTPKGMALPEKDRFRIAAIIKEVVTPGLVGNGRAEAAEQLFPPFGQGALDNEKLNRLREKMQARPGDIYPGKFTAWNLPKSVWPDLRKRFPNAEFKHVMALPGRADYKSLGENEPELFFHRTDTSIKEDISFFSYYMSGYFFSINGGRGAEWVRDYADTAELSIRMEKFNKLHYDTLISGVTVPLTFSSYIAAARKPWVMNFFSLHAGTTFWRMKWI